jgi:hypothetical protein
MLRVRPSSALQRLRGPLAFVCKPAHTALIPIDCQLHSFAPMTKSEAISVRVSPNIKKAAERAAAEDSRSVASLVEKLLVEWLKANNYLK